MVVSCRAPSTTSRPSRATTGKVDPAITRTSIPTTKPPSSSIIFTHGNALARESPPRSRSRLPSAGWRTRSASARALEASAWPPIKNGYARFDFDDVDRRPTTRDLELVQRVPQGSTATTDRGLKLATAKEPPRATPQPSRSESRLFSVSQRFEASSLQDEELLAIRSTRGARFVGGAGQMPIAVTTVGIDSCGNCPLSWPKPHRGVHCSPDGHQPAIEATRGATIANEAAAGCHVPEQRGGRWASDAPRSTICAR